MNDKTEEQATEIILPVESGGKARDLSPAAEHPSALMHVEQPSESQALMSVIQQVALNPKADIEKIKELKNMMYEFQDREADRQYGADMALCQGEIEPVARNAINKFTNNSTYAKLDAICKAINPIYSKFGFSVNATLGISQKENHILVLTTIRHRGGHKEVIPMDWPVDNKGMQGGGNKTELHGTKSTVTYARGTAICMAFNVATTDGDNDGNGAQVKPTQETITDDQVKELETLIAKSSTTAESLCEQAGIFQLSELRKEHFGPAKQHIRECGEPAQ